MKAPQIVFQMSLNCYILLLQHTLDQSFSFSASNWVAWIDKRGYALRTIQWLMSFRLLIGVLELGFARVA